MYEYVDRDKKYERFNVSVYGILIFYYFLHGAGVLICNSLLCVYHVLQYENIVFD